MSIRKKIKQYLNKWSMQGYLNDIPDEVPNQLMKLGLAPSYKAIALAILKNDHNMQDLGFSPPKSPWYSAIKRIEIAGRKTK